MEEIRSAGSFGRLADLLARYTQEHITRTYEEAAQDNGLCLIILILSSLFIVLAAIAIIVYVILLGLVPFDDILNQIISSACP